MHDELTGEEGSGPWPAFADLLAATTLLFLVLFAAVAVPAIQRAGAADARENTLKKLEVAIRGADTDSRVSVRRVGDYLLVRIEGDATFPVDRFELAKLKPEGKVILRSFGGFLRRPEVLPNIDQVQVVGHTSSEGSPERNWILSASRAATVSLFLIDSVGIPACQVSALGRSRYYPVNPAAAASGHVDEADRRIELEIRPVIPSDTVQQARRKSCVERRG
ncbi:MAG TPA: OmpA family protein [Longimicrobiaceae bacterium]|nr:OmpA family protein [Longimicrobiaceae bacterium]